MEGEEEIRKEDEKKKGKEQDRLGAGEGKRSCCTRNEAAQVLLSVPSKDSGAISILPGPSMPVLHPLLLQAPT